jgi:DNA-binding response OmpR family regulator
MSIIPQPHLLVIDDDPAMTSVLKRGLTYEGFLVETADSGTEGLTLATTTPPDLVILDIMMPDLDGLAVLQQLRTHDPHLPILMLTARDTTADQVQGLEQGADDYVVKPFSFEVLLARVRALLRRRGGGRPGPLIFADLSLDPTRHQVQRGTRLISLTKTEYKLLRQFLEQPEQILSREFLMERVWGYDFGGQSGVLDTYIKQVRQKLEVAGEPRLIHTVHGVGYILREE